jgi:hypothetical protein
MRIAFYDLKFSLLPLSTHTLSSPLSEIEKIINKYNKSMLLPLKKPKNAENKKLRVTK